jgi:hypothetical protein
MLDRARIHWLRSGDVETLRKTLLTVTRMASVVVDEDP